MKVRQAINWLNELSTEDEILVSWYQKEDFEQDGEALSQEVWSKAITLVNDYSSDELRILLEYAIDKAKTMLKESAIK